MMLCIETPPYPDLHVQDSMGCDQSLETTIFTKQVSLWIRIDLENHIWIMDALICYLNITLSLNSMSINDQYGEVNAHTHIQRERERKKGHKRRDTMLSWVYYYTKDITHKNYP